MANNDPFKDLAYSSVPWDGELKASTVRFGRAEMQAAMEEIFNAPARLEPRRKLISTTQYDRLTAGCKRCGTHDDVAWLIYNPELLCLNCDDRLTTEQKAALLFSV